jgi:uncharacterized protein YlxW (UPF0749 family)
MSLLVDMMANTLDEAYAERAARRAGAAAGAPAAPARRSAPGRRTVALLVLVLLGLLTGTAIAQVRDRQASTDVLRADLADEVRARTSESDALAASAERLRAEVAAQSAALLGGDEAGRAAGAQLERLDLLTGSAPVQGPGVRVVLADAPAAADQVDAAPRGGASDTARISDRNLQDLVNALWAAGAEAVDVNGQRLTALTAIRSAGEAVLVDFRPLSPPYVVQAVGDPSDLQVELLDGPTGRRLTTYVSLYGWGLEVERVDRLRLSGAGLPELRSVRRPPGAGS